MAENQRLGESHTIKINLQWEQTRYLATMIHNVNCQKKSQMIKAEKLFPLPQDKYLKHEKPKSTKEELEELDTLGKLKEEFLSFKEKAIKSGVKF